MYVCIPRRITTPIPTENPGSASVVCVWFRTRMQRRISYFHRDFGSMRKQECIPVGCVPPGSSSRPGGVSTRPGSPGGSSPREEAPPRGSTPQEEASPLLTESQSPVKILPCPNFVAGGNDFHLVTFEIQDG